MRSVERWLAPVLFLCAAHLLAAPPPNAEDIGPADPSLAVEAITLPLQPSAAQRADLQHFLAAQQDPSSLDFHRWLTPEQFADRFGLSQSDLAKASTWLRSQGFRIDSTARGRTWIVFSGTAGQLQSAFHLHMRRFRLNGRIHYGNADQPIIPAELSGLVAGFRGLNDFPLHTPPQPLYNGPNAHFLVPDDIAVIYDTAASLNSGINGSGIKIGIPGGSAIATSDIAAFRAKYNLSATLPQVILVPGTTDPGTVSGPMTEAHIDIEWSGAIAPNASIIYAYAKNVFNAEQYLIDNNAAQVISSSFGSCESQGSAFDNMLAQQANAQGITWVTSAGDTGPDFCDSGATSISGLTVGEPASYPEVTGVGSTTFNEGSGVYWSSTNGPNLGSALAYIPEVAWNDTASVGRLSASGGGASALFPKPLWQNAPGVPADGARDVPDVALTGSPNHDGYEVSTGGTFQIYGGTSVSTPVFAGLVALLNHSLVSRGILAQPGLGNINPTLYRLARTVPAVFHDVTQGNNLIPCQSGSPNCNSSGMLGFFAGPGYDQVTGLGSIDFASLAAQWTIPGAVPSNVVVTASPNPVYSKNVTFTLSETNGGATKVTGFSISGQDASSQIASDFGTATIAPYDSISAALNFPNVSPPITGLVTFSGVDPSGRTWSQQLSLQFLPPQPASATTIVGVSNGASFKTVYAQGMIMSVFGTNFASATQAASSLPLPPSLLGVSASVNGVAAPLYFVSPGQVNLQIPYGTAAGPATLSVTGSGGTATFPFTVQANSPGIFAASGALVPFSTAKAGDTLLAFITGEGAVSPAISTGATPSPTTPLTQLPAPTAHVVVTVGGVNAPLAFVGVPSGLAGATQINFVVPTVPAGPQPVVVTIGGVSSPAVLLTVTQ
jgi:uncharacterized protein (TIGR03437 family)